MQTPPMTQDGIESTNATSGVMNENRMQPNAAVRIVRVLALPVIATHAMDSP